MICYEKGGTTTFFKSKTMKKTRHLILALLILSLLTGCATLLGIKKISLLDDKEIIQTAENINISLNDPLFKINVDSFRKHFQKGTIDTTRAFKDVLQPLQIKAYDNSQILTLYLVNCYVGGLPKLKWNRLNTFDHYPLLQGPFFVPDSGRSVSQTLDFLVPIRGSIPSLNELAQNDTSIFVYWTKFMGRHSKELIKLIKSYQAKFSDKKIKAYYVNVDNLLNYE